MGSDRKAAVSNATAQPVRMALSPIEVAKLLGLSKSSVYRLLEAGELWSRRVGERYLVPIPAVVSFLEGHEYAPPQREDSKRNRDVRPGAFDPVEWAVDGVRALLLGFPEKDREDIWFRAFGKRPPRPMETNAANALLDEWDDHRIAREMGVDITEVRRLIVSASRKVGERYIVPISSLMAFVEGRTYDPANPWRNDASFLSPDDNAEIQRVADELGKSFEDVRRDLLNACRKIGAPSLAAALEFARANKERLHQKANEPTEPRA